MHLVSVKPVARSATPVCVGPMFVGVPRPELVQVAVHARMAPPAVLAVHQGVVYWIRLLASGQMTDGIVPVLGVVQPSFRHKVIPESDFLHSAVPSNCAAVAASQLLDNAVGILAVALVTYGNLMPYVVCHLGDVRSLRIVRIDGRLYLKYDATWYDHAAPV